MGTHYFSSPSRGPWSFKLPSHKSREGKIPAMDFFKANFYPDPDRTDPVWAIIAQITTTATGYVAHWGILPKRFWSTGENIDEIEESSPRHMWLYPSGLGVWRDTLTKRDDWGSVRVGFEISTPSRDKSGTASFTLNPQWFPPSPPTPPVPPGVQLDALLSLIGASVPIVLTGSMIGLSELAKAP
jgi:hypothetical protein